MRRRHQGDSWSAGSVLASSLWIGAAEANPDTEDGIHHLPFATRRHRPLRPQHLGLSLPTFSLPHLKEDHFSALPPYKLSKKRYAEVQIAMVGTEDHAFRDNACPSWS